MADERGSGERSSGRKTVPLRGPGAGGFTPAQSVAASNPCLNCGTNIQLEFCPECGQRAIDVDPTIRDFTREMAKDFVHWDGKLLSTLRLLVTKPGELTLEFLAGRRVRFISPLRLFLAFGAIFFIASALLPEAGLPRGSSGQLARLIAAMKAAPIAIVIMLPVFAGLFTFAFRDRRDRYLQHVVFALHVHGVFFLGMTTVLATRLAGGAVRLTSAVVVASFLAAYLVLATNRVYGDSGTFLRLALVVALYLVTLAAAVMGIATITARAV